MDKDSSALNGSILFRLSISSCKCFLLSNQSPTSFLFWFKVIDLSGILLSYWGVMNDYWSLLWRELKSCSSIFSPWFIISDTLTFGLISGGLYFYSSVRFDSIIDLKYDRSQFSLNGSNSSKWAITSRWFLYSFFRFSLKSLLNLYYSNFSTVGFGGSSK